MKKPTFRERECVHRGEGHEGDFYNGELYLQAMQRLPIARAMQVASKVSSFFWVDAPHILVWLCADCAMELGLADTPSALIKTARRQA